MGIPMTERTDAVPQGRRLLRIEARNAATTSDKRPAWLTKEVRPGPRFLELQELVHSGGLRTVCQEASCPNIYECWEDSEATFLIGGDLCSRRCDFCDIGTGRPRALDPREPLKIAEAVGTMGIRYATVTGVARDDLPDGGAWLYAETVRTIHRLNTETDVELLIPDFSGVEERLDEVFESSPQVLAHNVETVPRIFRRVRPAFRYERSLAVIERAHAAGLLTKSNLILGMGEEPDEVERVLVDLRAAGCDLLTVTQYLRPSPRHLPVHRWVTPAEFEEVARLARGLGFAGVQSGPLVRSSYRAGRMYTEATARSTDSRQRASQPDSDERAV